MQGVDLIITITDRSRAEQFASWFRSHGISLVLTALGQGTATTEVLDFLGLEATEKAVLFCVAPRSPRMVRQAARELWLDVPGQGVLMTVPVNSIGGSTAKEYLLHEQEGEAAMERESTHDLIVVIANQGSTDLVMDAAREAGATGGTVIHAKGTGTELVQKFFGVSIATEQEMIFILTRSETKKPIMKAVMAKAGDQQRRPGPDLLSAGGRHRRPAGAGPDGELKSDSRRARRRRARFFSQLSCTAAENFGPFGNFLPKEAGVSPVFQKIPAIFLKFSAKLRRPRQIQTDFLPLLCV